MMRFGSVCSGIEAASVAWHGLGWEAAWLAEVDVSASAILAHRLGATAPRFPLEGSEKSLKRIEWGNRLVNWGDMTRLPELVRSGEAEAPDILCGGTPCQGFSLAGLRGGLIDPRSQLTLKFVELANVIDDTRTARGQPACAILYENVPGLRSDSGNAFGHFLAALVGAEDSIEPGPRPEPARSSTHWSWKKETSQHIPKWSSAGVVAGPRRTVGWRCLDAQFFGLAQRRKRVFVVASAMEGFDPAAVLFEFDGLRRDTAPSRQTGEGFTHSLAPCLTSSGRGVERTGDLRGQDPVVAFVPERSSGVKPHGFRMTAFGEYADDDTASTMKSRDYKDATDLVVTPILEAVAVTLRGREGGGTAELGDDVAGTLRASGGGGDKPHVLAFSCKDYGNDVTDDLAPTMRAMGDSGSHANAGGQLAVCVTGDITHTLKAEGFDASEDGTGRGQPIVPYDMAVRRLMPVECERLMGFPDNYTLVPVGKKLAADGPRYKQLGNSWAVPCVTWIGKRLDRHLAELNGRVIDMEAVTDDSLMHWICLP